MEGIPRRIVLIGSESTGKTTLAAELARHFQTIWVPEYVRAYADRKGALLDASDVDPIARGQMMEQDAALLLARQLLILDTDLLSTVVYAEHYYGGYAGWIGEAALDRRGDLYLLCDIDVPWTPDPQRDRPGDRALMQGLFREALISRALPFVDIRGGWQERFEAGVTAVTRP